MPALPREGNRAATEEGRMTDDEQREAEIGALELVVAEVGGSAETPAQINFALLLISLLGRLQAQLMAERTIH